MSAFPQIGELWVHMRENSSGCASGEEIVIIDYLDEDVIWFSYIQNEDDDDWCAVDYFIKRSRRYNG